MKLFTTCMQCLEELGHPSFEPFIADYYGDGVVQLECSRGHKTAQMIQSAKFEILMESGAAALLQGFTLEACASFSAALERFYEFSVHVMCAALKMPSDLYAKMFAEMERQSERQLGAFMLLHALDFGQPYRPQQKLIEFRNAIIHKGEIPDAEKATKFASQVYSVITALCSQLKAKHGSVIIDLRMQSLGERRLKLPDDILVATSSGTTFFNLANANIETDFAKALKRFAEMKKITDASVPYMRALHASLMGRASSV